MEKNELRHWGIKGMKWGIRRFQNKDGSLTPAGKKRYDNESEGDSDEKTSIPKVNTAPEHTPKKVRKAMSEAELKTRIERLKLEKDLTDLENKVYQTRGKDFVLRVLEKSGENIATQFTTLAMGTAVNKVLQTTLGSVDAKYKTEDFVNPKKGQKDK